MDRLLVDSHVLLWFVAGDRRRIGPRLRARLEGEPVAISAASLWEVAIKVALGKLDAPDNLPARVEELGFEQLAVTAEHAWAVRRLPLHHRDPFDRILIAQAQVEQLAIVTADPAFGAYDVTIAWS